MERIIENNQVTLSGEIVENFAYSHEIFGEKFYTSKIEIQRKSDRTDILPITVSERIADANADWTGRHVRISGNFRSYNKYEDGKTRLILSVFVRELEVWEDDGEETPIDKNTISIDGCIVKEPIYRTTPLGRNIADILLGVNRPYRQSDYLPSICWGRVARLARNLEVGAHIKAKGRIQSREYQKKISEDVYETRTAYEVSISTMEVVEDEQAGEPADIAQAG